MESLSALGLAILNPVNNTKIAPQFLPSHIPSIDAPLLYSTDFTNLDPYKSNVSKLTIRKVKPIMPLRVLNADIHRELKRSVDNTLFIYPLQLERCPQR